MTRRTALLMAALAAISRTQAPPRNAVAPAIDTSVRFRLVNGKSGLLLGIRSASRHTGAEAVATRDATGESVLWHVLPSGESRYRLVNMRSGALLGVAPSAAASQPDTGSTDHLWQFNEAPGGRYRIANTASGLILAVAPHGSRIILAKDDASAAELWELVPSGAAYPMPMSVTGDVGVHDPSMIRTADGTYSLFGTEKAIRLSTSTDRVHFTAAGLALAAMPSWVATYNRGELWAPDVSFHNGRYWLYYAASRWGKNTSAIGLATSQTAAPGSWTDQGIVVSSRTEDNYNAIDPGLLVDPAGRWWLSFGSFWGGIMMIEIDPASGKPASSNPARYPLAHRPDSPAIEGAYIYRHGPFYYLFASLDQCCHGVNSTYHIAVGRSPSPTGPYYDRAGVAMSQGGGSIILSSHGNIVGPGGQVVFRDGNEDLLVYHYYDGANNGRRTLGINRIQWDSEGWPCVQ